jgi:hypothetical protein
MQPALPCVWDVALVCRVWRMSINIFALQVWRVSHIVHVGIPLLQTVCCAQGRFLQSS